MVKQATGPARVSSPTSPTVDTPSTPASTSGWNKRRKPHDDINDPSGSKKRTRVSYSCGECHRRKQKCNREMPCSHCVARKVPELCKAYTPGKSDQDLPARVSRLEQIIDSAFPQFSFSMDSSMSNADPSHIIDMSRSGSAGGDDSDISPDEGNTMATSYHQSSRLDGGRWYGESVSTSIAPTAVLEQLQNMGHSMHQQPQMDNTRSRSGSGSAHGHGHHVQAMPDHMQNPELLNMHQAFERSAADNMKHLVQDYGVSPHKIAELLHELPPPRFSAALVDFYFSSINWTRYPISERDFRASFASICANGLNANPDDVRFLPLLFVVLAIAVRLAPEHIAGTAQTRRLTSMRYYWSSRRSLLIAVAVQPDSLDMILTRLLSARFLTFDRRITECWSLLGAAVRTAQALGLHRDGAAMGLDPQQVEYRRRIWSYLYHADRSYALVLGRPNAIQDDYTSTLPPLNVEDDATLNHIQCPPPLSTPTRMTFVILRHTLASIIGRMVHHFQQVKRRSGYSDVLELDKELMRFVGTLPPHYSMEPDTSLDHTLTFLPVHRCLLITEILFVRISLHRPYLLRRLNSDRYVHSRKACFASALQDFRVRQAFRAAIPSDSSPASHSNAYREFQTAMIAGIYLVLEPSGPDANLMHIIMDTFMADHEGLPELDDTTRRELKIIEFLKAKVHASGRMEGMSGNPRQDNHATMEAHLLLGLQHGGSRPGTSRHDSSSSMQGGRSSYPGMNISPTLGPSHHSPSPSLTFVQPPPAMPTLSTSYGLQMDPFSGRSPTSNSPGGEEDSAAQSLLDHWCNTVNGAIDGLNTPGVLSDPTLGWMPPAVPGFVGEQTYELDGSDWNYWDALVNQIRGPVS